MDEGGEERLTSPPAVTEVGDVAVPRGASLTTPRRAVAISEDLLPKRLVVASNRLPFRVEIEDGCVRLEQGIGGLVTALDPVLRFTGGLWLGWSGSHRPLPDGIPIDRSEEDRNEYELRPLDLSEEEVSRYYLGYANRSIWPLFHYFQEHCRFEDVEWETYVAVNRKFADKIVEQHREGDFIWIQDYHLMLVPGMIRERIPGANIGFFLHIPFPPPELFQIDLHALQLLEGLLGADLVGFHTSAYTRNFLRTVVEMTDTSYSVSGGWVRRGDRKVHVGSFPISIDFNRFAGLAGEERVQDRARAIREIYRAGIVAVGVDRLDYTKGILERLRAIETMLERHPDVQGNFTFIQLSAPSRTKVHTYRQLRGQVEQMVGRINGRFGGRGCLPVDYRYESHPQEELVAYYCAADLALVTPLRDGMNLVAKEYVASRVDGDGSLVLSGFAGARSELRDAVLVNPYHPESTADGIYHAIHLPRAARRTAMRNMRTTVQQNDIYRWLERFLQAQHQACRDR